MKILALESSAVSSSVAIMDDDKLIGEFYVNTKLKHSETLMPMVDYIIKSTKTSIEDIDLFAVSNGPGSFTGIRIGVSAIKGLAMALNKPCIGVSTLYSMAYNLLDINATVCAVIDARCNQVYRAIFEINSGKIKRLTEDSAVKIEDLYKELSNYKKDIIFVGDGSVLCYNNLDKDLYKNIKLANERLRNQCAFGVAKAAAKLSKEEKNIVSAEQLCIEYLRLPQAQRELNSRIAKKGE